MKIHVDMITIAACTIVHLERIECQYFETHCIGTDNKTRECLITHG